MFTMAEICSSFYT